MKKLLFAIVLCCPICVSAYSTSATSAILMDMDSGNVIYEKDSHNVRSIASISKIMTAVVAIESGKEEEVVTIGDEILQAYGSGIYIKQGEEMTLRDLLYGLMLRSGNDASYSIATYVGGSVDEFVNMMNEKAKEIGMKNTIFHNPNGLDEEGGNLSTAYDMALLTSYAMKNDSYKTIVSTKKHSVKTNMNYYSWINKNKLLFSFPYTTGGKTGFTDVAKRTLVTTASKENINLVVVTLNDGNDFQDHINLFKQAFEEYKNYPILQKGNITIIDEKYYLHDTLYIENNYSYTLKNNNQNHAVLNYKLEKKKDYQDGDQIGTIEVIINDKKVHEEPIYVKKQEKKSFFQKLKDWFKNLW